MEKFSKRHGFYSVEEVEITVRNDAPQGLRQFLVQLAYDAGIKPPSTLRTIVCQIMRVSPDKNNWSEYPNIDEEIRQILEDCTWYKVYDFIEILAEKMKQNQRYNLTLFERDLNEYFIENGIGWKIVKGRLEIRGPEAFESVIKVAQKSVADRGLMTASKELHEAISDLSRRPTPDTTGAIQHAMASLECVARKTTGNCKSTLGEIMRVNGNIIPSPLDQAVIKSWGYASEKGRHLKEGQEPTFNEAELIVGICASVGCYLAKLGDDKMR